MSVHPSVRPDSIMDTIRLILVAYGMKSMTL